MVKLASTSAGAGPTLAFHAGDSIFKEGDPGESLFIVEEGQVELVGGAGHQRIALLGAGDVFGELAVLESQPRDFGARAVTEVKVLRVDRAALEPLLRSPEVGLLMVHRLARRLHEARLPGAAAAAPAAEPARAKPPTVQAAPREGRFVHEASGTEFALPGDAKVMVGRSAKGHVPDVDLTPVDHDRSLSRRHAAVWREGITYMVAEETGVANGTFVNGKRIGPGEATALKDGDKVAFGLVKLVFRLA
jgi:hypothetical protein